MTPKEATIIFLGKKYLSYFHSAEYVTWAENLITSGCESESLYILAGMYTETMEEREIYFKKALQELNFGLKDQKPEDHLAYALYVCEAVSNSIISLDEGLHEMYSIYVDTEYNNSYQSFSTIVGDIQIIKDGFEPIHHQKLTLYNYSWYVQKAFNDFEKAHKR